MAVPGHCVLCQTTTCNVSGKPGYENSFLGCWHCKVTRQLVPEKDTDQSNMPSLDSSTKVPKLTKRNSWDLKGRIQDMEESFYTTQEQNEFLKQELEACNMRISSLESVNSLLHHDNEIKAVISEEAIIQIDELESQLKKKTEEAERLQKEICFLKQDIANGKKEYDNLKMMYEQETGFMKSTITNLTFLKSSIEAQLDATKLMLFTHENEISQLKMKCSDKDAEIKSLKEHNAEIESKLREEESLRRKLHNTIQELKGNIRVFCRMRPALSEEIKHGMNLLNVSAVTDKTIEIQHVTDIGHLTESAGKMHLKYEFSFDCYFPPYTSQEKVFSEISQLVQSALDGYNVCIFAYGQTGSGKTYTMEGPADILDFVANKNHPKLGMIPRSVSQIFSTIEELRLKGWKYRVEALFLEIYNERIRDLLNSQGGNSKCDILKSGNRGTDCVLSNVTTSEVTSCEQVYELMRKARMNRAVAATKCNEYSSRSHYVFQMKIYGENSVTGEKCESTLNLVDLAGSERLKDSESVGERLNEAKAINKSLSNLGKVIMSLSRKESYIPYRDSKLTHLLANSLGGNCKTLMFVNISPDNKNLCETLNSLRFATKVNKCDIGTAHKRIK